MTEKHLCGLWKLNEFSKLESWQQVSCLTFKPIPLFLGSGIPPYLPPLLVFCVYCVPMVNIASMGIKRWETQSGIGDTDTCTITTNYGKCHDGGGGWIMCEPRKEASHRVCGVGTTEKAKAKEAFC